MGFFPLGYKDAVHQWVSSTLLLSTTTTTTTATTTLA